MFENEASVIDAQPDMALLKTLALRGVAITAKSVDYDFVTRFFSPRYGIDEDPVTGSAFTQLMPYWATRLDQSSMRAKQISPRGGVVAIKMEDGRVKITGSAITYLTRTIIMAD